MEFIVTIQEPEIQVVYVATQGEQGVAGLIWIDAGWADATDYVVDNALEHNGSSYRAFVAHTSSAATEPGVGVDWETVWKILAEKGEDGLPGTTVHNDTTGKQGGTTDEFFHLTEAQHAGIAASPTPITGANPAVSQADISEYPILANPRPTSDKFITEINPFDDATDFVNQGNGTVATDNSIFFDQTSSVRMDMGAGQNVNLRFDLPAPLDLTKTSFTFAVRTEDRANMIASSVTVWQGSNTAVIEGLSGRYMRNDLEWTPMSLNIGDITSIGSVDLTQVDRINVRFASTTAQSVWLNSLGFMANAFPLNVFITFDDGSESDLTVSKPILDRAGMVASSFQVTSLIGDSGKLTSENLLTLFDAGWEIGSHSDTHINYEDSTQEEMEADLSSSRAALIAGGILPMTFSYPFGAWDELSESIVPDFFKLRMDGTQFGDAPSKDWAGRLYRINGEETLTATVTDYITKLETHGGSIGVNFHEIGGTGYDVNKFQTIIDSIAAGNNNVTTPMEFYRR